MKIEHDAWVVIADGRKALITQNIGQLFAPKLELRDHLEAPPNPPTHEQGTDKPGRSFDSTSHRRSGVEQTDWHDQAEAAFLRKVAEHLEQLCQTEKVRRVVLVAALAVLRAGMPTCVRQKTVAEVDKDYTKQPLAEIERRLAEL
jgi:protein required for attachment to host cells